MKGLLRATQRPKTPASCTSTVHPNLRPPIRGSQASVPRSMGTCAGRHTSSACPPPGSAVSSSSFHRCWPLGAPSSPMPPRLPHICNPPSDGLSGNLQACADLLLLIDARCLERGSSSSAAQATSQDFRDFSFGPAYIPNLHYSDSQCRSLGNPEYLNQNVPYKPFRSSRSVARLLGPC